MSLRRSPRLAAATGGGNGSSSSNSSNGKRKKQPEKTPIKLGKEAEEKRAARAKRKNRGMRRADTFFEYEGHPETRESVENPFNSLMGKTIEIYFGKDRTWKRARVLEFHAFDGLHLVEFNDKTRKFFNLGKKRYRFVKEATNGDAGPKKPKIKKEKTIEEKKKQKPGEEDEEEEVDDEDEGMDVGAAGTGPDADASVGSTSVVSSVATTSAKAKLNPACGLTTAHVLEEGGVVYEAELSYINLAQNSDKYYVVQVAEEADKSAYYCVNHWGRTGTLGQFKLQKGSKEDAIEAFKAKFQEKTGIPFEDRSKKAPVPGRYRFKKKDYTTVPPTGHVMWQYYVDDFVDGKATGWYNYVETAANTVEGVYSEWRVNDWLDVRCVQSGYFQYRVDFNTMTQTNLRTGKCRRIRRVDENGVVTTV